MFTLSESRLAGTLPTATLLVSAVLESAATPLADSFVATSIDSVVDASAGDGGLVSPRRELPSLTSL